MLSVQASVASAISFSIGAAIPLLSAAFPQGPHDQVGPAAGHFKKLAHALCKTWPCEQLCGLSTFGLPPMWPATLPGPGTEHQKVFNAQDTALKTLQTRHRLYVVLAASTLGLAIFGAVGAALGGASMLRGSTRVVLGGVLAMAVS